MASSLSPIQLGGFFGVWLGGRMYDASGDYTMVWWIGIMADAFPAFIHLPVNETPLGEREIAASATAV